MNVSVPTSPVLNLQNLRLQALPAFTDNYIWMLTAGNQAVVVDPGDAQVVLSALKAQNLDLHSILITHHHSDHTGGVQELRQATGCRVFGAAGEVMPEPLQRLSGGEKIAVLGHEFRIIDVPGHTAGHIAYFCENWAGKPLLFCGDTLFSGGCGRLFEGTPAQMLSSLDALAALPANTRVCCTHEYTLSNLRFARAVEPDNAELKAYEAHCQALRSRGEITLPSSIGLELKINPFLRSRQQSVAQAARTFNPSAANEIDDFAALREWKNQFK